MNSRTQAWAHLSLYFTAKLRGGIALATVRQTGQSTRKTSAIEHLKAAADHWDDVVAVTDAHYQEAPYRKHENFAW